MIILTKDYLDKRWRPKPIYWPCPFELYFFFSTRMPVHGGGLAAVFKDNFHGRITPTEVYDSFELQMS